MAFVPRNDVRLVGRIGSIKFKKRADGKDYAYLALEIPAKDMSTSEDETHYTVHTRCFKKPYVDYLRENAKVGSVAVIFGFVVSYPSEHKGESVLNNGITINEVYISK